MSDADVVHNEQESRYELRTPAGLAVLAYVLDGDRLALVHTEVPRSVEGRGVGGALVKFALDDARNRGLRVLPMCAFVKAYIARHPAYAPLVAKR